MSSTGTFTITDLLRESGLNANVIEGVYRTSSPGTGRALVSDELEHFGVSTDDVRALWIFLPRLGAVRRCSQVGSDAGEGDGNRLELRSDLETASGEEFWLLRENPTLLATAVRQQLLASQEEFTVPKDVVLRPGRSVPNNLDSVAGDTGGWSWRAGVLHIRMEGVLSVDSVYVGERERTYNASLGMSGRYADFDFDRETRELLVYGAVPDNRVYTVRVWGELLSDAEVLSLEPLSVSGGELQIGSATVKGSVYDRGISGSDFLALMYRTSAQIFDEMGTYQGYEEKLGFQRQATSRRNRADEFGTLGVGRLS